MDGYAEAHLPRYEQAARLPGGRIPDQRGRSSSNASDPLRIYLSESYLGRVPHITPSASVVRAIGRLAGNRAATSFVRSELTVQRGNFKDGADPELTWINWPHIQKNHWYDSEAPNKGKWADTSQEIIWIWIFDAFWNTRQWLKPEHVGKPNRRLWYQSPDTVGVTGAGAPTKGIILWVSVTNSTGKCKIQNAYPGEYERD